MFFLTQKRELNDRDFEIAQVPDRYIEANLSEIPDECDHKKFISKYINDFEKFVKNGIGLLLYGNVGNGKTSIAVMLLKEVMSHGGSCHFATSEEVVKAIGFNGHKIIYDNGIREMHIMDRYRMVSMLIIDDLGAEEPNEKAKSEIEKLIRYRYGRYKTTIVTSNLKPKSSKKTEESILSLYGTPMFNVFKECMIPITVKGYDFREKASKDILLYMKD